MTDYRDTNLQLRALDRGGGSFNALAYGAVRDGVTSSVAGLTAAITAASAVNGEVFVPHGRYLVDSALDIPSNVSFRGAGSGTVFVIAPAIASGLWMTVVGLVGTYRTGVRLSSFHVERSGAGGIRFQYARYCQVSHVTCTGTGGGILSIRDIDKCQFSSILGWSLGVAGGAAIFAVRISDCQFSDIFGEGGQESIDLFETHRCTLTNVTGMNCGDECLDMGCSTYNTVTNLIAYNCATNGVSVKVEDGGTSGGTFRNTFTNIVITGHSTYGFSLSSGQNVPTGAEILDYNRISNLFIYSATAGALGVRWGQGTTGLGNPPLKGNSLSGFTIIVPGIGLQAAGESNDMTIENGYIECSGSAVNPVEMLGIDDSHILDRLAIRRVHVKAASLSSSTYCFTFARCMDLEVADCRVVSTSGGGMQFQRCKDFVVGNNVIKNCGYDGIRFTIVDEANWRGTINGSFEGNKISNVGTASANRFCIRMLNNAAANVTEAVHVLCNRFFDTQGTTTSNGMQVNGGTGLGFDYCTYVGNSYRNLASGLTGTFPGAGGASSGNLDASARA